MSDPASTDPEPESIYSAPAADEEGKKACPECGELFADTFSGKMAWGRHRLKAHGIASTKKTGAPTTERAPKMASSAGTERRPSTRRTPADGVLTMAWGGFGSMLVRTGRDVPVGRVMQFQAPIAGPVIDRWVAGRFFDRWLLQRIARNADQLEQVASIAMLPVLVGAWERNPAAQPILEPLTRQAIRANLVAMVPVVKKMKAEEAKFAAAMADLGELFEDVPEGMDPVSFVLAQIFSPPPEAQQPAPEDVAAPFPAA